MGNYSQTSCFTLSAGANSLFVSASASRSGMPSGEPFFAALGYSNAQITVILSCVSKIHSHERMSCTGKVSSCEIAALEDPLVMAEVIKLRVKCHACSNLIEGSARYGGGHYVPEGVDFEFVAIGKVDTPKGRRVKAEITAVCPNCGVRCKWTI